MAKIELAYRCSMCNEILKLGNVGVGEMDIVIHDNRDPYKEINLHFCPKCTEHLYMQMKTIPNLERKIRDVLYSRSP